MEDLTQLTSALDSKWAHVVTQLVIAVMILGRIYHAIRNGGGLVSIWRGLLYGTNTPAPRVETKPSDEPFKGPLPPPATLS